MKKCNECNVEMIENCIIDGQHPFELGADGSTDLTIHIPTNEQGSFLGMKYDKSIELEFRARVCPKCGKVELYVDPEKIKHN